MIDMGPRYRGEPNILSAAQARELTAGGSYTDFRARILNRIQNAASSGKKSLEITDKDIRGGFVTAYVSGDSDPSYVIDLVKELASAGYIIKSVRGYGDQRDYVSPHILVSW